MNVGKLIELLKKEDKDRLVVMSSDGEGNNYSPFSDLSTGAYEADSTWSGEVGLQKLTDVHKAEGYTAEDVMIEGVPALILWPAN